MSDHTVPRALYTEAATELQQAHIGLFPGDGHGGRSCVCVRACVRVWAVIPVDLGRKYSRNTCIISRKVQWTLLGPRSRLGGKVTWNMSGLPPRWDCSPRRVNLRCSAGCRTTIRTHTPSVFQKKPRGHPRCIRSTTAAAAAAAAAASGTTSVFVCTVTVRSAHQDVCVCVLHIKPFFLPVDIQHNQCPCRFSNPRRDTSSVVTKLRHRDTTLPRVQ